MCSFQVNYPIESVRIFCFPIVFVTYQKQACGCDSYIRDVFWSQCVRLTRGDLICGNKNYCNNMQHGYQITVSVNIHPRISWKAAKLPSFLKHGCLLCLHTANKCRNLIDATGDWFRGRKISPTISSVIFLNNYLLLSWHSLTFQPFHLWLMKCVRLNSIFSQVARLLLFFFS